MKSLHIICAKCGSARVRVVLNEPTEDDSGVSFSCRDCGELTGAEELQEQLAEEQGYRLPK